MPQFETRRRLPYTARQMYDLVADVERYPEFLPLCDVLRIRSRAPKENGEELICDMEVGYFAIRERFKTRVLLDPAQSRIVANYIEGPFRQLENRWRFTDVAIASGGGSEVDFFIAYEFKSMLLQMLMGSMFDTAFRKFTDAFEQRARQVYGPGGAV